MNSEVDLFLALLAGLLFGGIFYGGLWWTVQRALTSHRPILCFLSSSIFRMCSALFGFYLIASTGDWLKVLTCLVGFLVARILVTRLLRTEEEKTYAP